MHRARIVIGVAIFAAAAGVPIVAQAPESPSLHAGPKGATAGNPSANAGLLPGTRANVFPTIRGNALTANNEALPNTVVRLRDARFGRIVDTQVTDNAGLFTFTTVDPGSYVVEVMGRDQTVMAASQIINVNSGDAVTAIVKLPLRGVPLAGVLGKSATSAAVVAGAAAAAGVLAVTVSDKPASDRPIS
jgi:hypothetical protein